MTLECSVLRKTCQSITSDDIKHICDAVVELTKIRAADCPHLAVENFSVELFGKMIAELEARKSGRMVSA
jgi:hypothetical protein